MKKAIELSIPLLLVVAIFIVHYSGIGAEKTEETAITYSDIEGHWAEVEIMRWSSKGVLGGSDGMFRPDDSLSLAEFAVVLSRVLPMEDKARNIYTDVENAAWYSDALLKCVAAGIIEDGGKTELGPAESVKREAAFLMLARAFGIEPVEGTALLDAYNDKKNVSPQAVGYIEALLQAGITDEHSAQQIYPQQEITRAELVTLLDKLWIEGYIKD